MVLFFEREDPSVVIKDVLGELEEKGNEEGDGDGDENMDDGRDENYLLVCLSDSSPARKRHKYVLSELDEALARLLTTLRMPDPHELLADADEEVFNVFRDTLGAHTEIVHITKSRLPLDNQFFLDLTEPKIWINTTHMEVLMSIWGVSTRHT